MARPPKSFRALLQGWDRSVPSDDNSSWRGAAVADAYVLEALASDAKIDFSSVPLFRSPNGAREDIFYLAAERQLWDTNFVDVPRFVVPPNLISGGSPTDREELSQHLVHTACDKFVTVRSFLKSTGIKLVSGRDAPRAMRPSP
jgi:hypothetical protein